jgi:hypothetical protein
MIETTYVFSFLEHAHKNVLLKLNVVTANFLFKNAALTDFCLAMG